MGNTYKSDEQQTETNIDRTKKHKEEIDDDDDEADEDADDDDGNVNDNDNDNDNADGLVNLSNVNNNNTRVTGECIWPRDWLSEDVLFPSQLRILSIGFRSSLIHQHGRNHNNTTTTISLTQRADQFRQKIRTAGVGQTNPKHYTIFITHSATSVLILVIDSINNRRRE